VVDESALRRVVGSPRVHAAQLRHLLAAAALDTVTLQVLPASVGAHAALASSFTLLRFDSPDQSDIAYVEHSLGALLMEKEADVRRARLLFDRLRSDALSPADSVDLITQLAERS
jgi:hypothetical protein